MRTLSILHREWRKLQTAILDTQVQPSHDTKGGNVQESCTCCSLYQGHLSGLTREWPWGRGWFEPVSVRTRKPNNVARIMQTNVAARFIDCVNERNDSRCWMKSLTDFKLCATCANIVQHENLTWRQAIAACCVQHWCRAMSCQHVAFVRAERYSGLVFGSLSSSRKLHRQKGKEQKEEIIVGYIGKR